MEHLLQDYHTIETTKMTERSEETRKQDEALLATLGYKQEFKRAFTPLEVSPYHYSGHCAIKDDCPTGLRDCILNYRTPTVHRKRAFQLYT